MNIDDIVNS